MPKVLCPPQLLSAASLFQLDALQRHCEILCSQTLSVESAVNTYKYAKVRTARPPLHPGAPEVTAAPWGHLQRGRPAWLPGVGPESDPGHGALVFSSTWSL